MTLRVLEGRGPKPDLEPQTTGELDLLDPTFDSYDPLLTNEQWLVGEKIWEKFNG